MNSLVLSGTPGKWGPSEPEVSEEEEVSSLCKDWMSKPGKNVVIKRREEGPYPKRRRIAGGASEGPSSERLTPAIVTGRARVFAGRRRKEVL